MKKLVYAFASLSLIALVGLASCKKKEDVKEFSINSTKLSLGIGETKTLTVSNYDGTVEWSVSGDAATITPSNGADCKVTGAKEGTATVTAKNGDKSVSCTVTVKKSAGEFPDIPNPGAGKAVVAFYYEGTDNIDCNGIVFHGTNDNWTHTGTLAEFEAIEGYPGWFKAEITLGESAFSRPPFDNALAIGKACILNAEGVVDGSWTTQWAKTSAPQKCTIDPDHGDSETAGWDTEEGNMLCLTASSVIYVMVPSFNSNPCVQSKTYKFQIKLPETCDPENDVPGLVGDFSNWGQGAEDEDVELEWNPSTNYWEATVEGQATYNYKIRCNNDWSYELEHVVTNPDTELPEWAKYGDTALGENTTIVLDKSQDSWQPCLRPLDQR